MNNHAFILLIELLLRNRGRYDEWFCQRPWKCYCEHCVFWETDDDDEQSVIQSFTRQYSFDYMIRVAERMKAPKSGETNFEFSRRHGITRRQASKARAFARNLGFSI